MPNPKKQIPSEFLIFSYFAIYSTSQVKYQQNMRNEGNICHIAQGYHAITSLSLAKTMDLEELVSVILNNIK